MKGKFWLPAVGMALLCACMKHPTVPNGTQILDEDITLTRLADKPVDTSARELTVSDDAILVAFVDENLTDVRLTLAIVGAEEGAPRPVEVENNLLGAGIELAALDVPEDARVRVTLTSAQDSVTPGKVHLRVRQYAASAASDPAFAAQLRAFKAWTIATNSSFRAQAARETGLLEMQSAINGFDSPQGDAALAAHAHLIRARMLYFFRLDWREARAEAQRAAAAFAQLSSPDAVGQARAKFVEALALVEMSNDPDAREPTADEAKKLARETFDQLSAPTSVLDQVERARAIGAAGQLDLKSMIADSASKHFERARAMYEAEGYTAGEREMRCQLGMVLVETGQFAAAAQAFDALLPEVGKITSPELRVKVYIAAARGRSLASRTDESVELLLKALPLAREYDLRPQEATAVEGLGYLYQNRGDLLQAGAFFDEALNLTRDQKDVEEYVWALASAGSIARANGDLERAFKLHKEAVRRAPTPIAQVRTRLELGADHYRNGDYPAAIAMDREALAVDLHDPKHHAYTDGKLGLALFLLEYDQSTPKDLEEAARLVSEAMENSVRVKDQYRVIYTTRVQAQLDARLRNGKALAGYERVFALAQEYRERSASTEARSGLMADEELAFRGYLDLVFADAVKRGAGVVRPASAAELAGLERLERARYTSFGALRVGALDAATAAHVDRLLAQMAQKSLRIAALIKSDADTAQQAELSGLQSEMAGLHAELDSVRSSAARQIRGPASSTARTWRSIAPGVAQLSYALGTEHVYAAVRSESGTFVTVLAPSKTLEAQLTALADLDVQTRSREIEEALEQISVALLPVGLLPEKSSAVEIVAEGRIASVPFPALRSPTNTQRRLAQTHVVTMVTSLLEVDDARRTAHARPFRFVALASGSGTYRAATLDPAPRLQAATKEIRVAADLFTARDSAAKIKLLVGADGNAAALRDIWASGADVVHFATHALADLRQPVASLLVLPAMDAGGKATYLTAGQVQGWRGDVELVFLSACESAIGPPQYAAGMPGLQRAFLRAGARGVIATLAPIEDVLAQEFAADFYARYTSGVPASQALSDTQRAWLAPKPGLGADAQLRRRVTALSHAYFGG
jgi:CHAT domain-containing protein